VEAKKEAIWLCDCGVETPQPSGPGVKMITHCPKCKAEHYRLEEPDGIVTEYQPAPEYFYKEFEESLNLTGQKERMLTQLAFNYFTAIRQAMDLTSELKSIDKKRGHMVEQALKRTKLVKRADMAWRYNIPMRKFLGRKKEDIGPKLMKGGKE
jgi:hypothetical protein